MCVWFNNYGLLKIPLFFSKKIKYSKNKKKSWSWAHKITKISILSSPPPPSSYTSGKVPDVAFKFWQKFREINCSWIEIHHCLTINMKKSLYFSFLDLNFPWKILSSAKYHPKKSLNNFLNQKFFVKSKISSADFLLNRKWRIFLEVICAFFLSVLVGTSITSLKTPYYPCKM
jgi:hypothetical protein